MSKIKYILIYPDDDSGNDDGVLDRVQMTDTEANELNEQYIINGSCRRWVKLIPRKMYGTSPYPPSYYE